jgi:hypothetical protein
MLATGGVFQAGRLGLTCKRLQTMFRELMVLPYGPAPPEIHATLIPWAPSKFRKRPSKRTIVLWRETDKGASIRTATFLSAGPCMHSGSRKYWVVRNVVDTITYWAPEIKREIDTHPDWPKGDSLYDLKKARAYLMCARDPDIIH